MAEWLEETLDANVTVKHTDARGKVLLEGTARGTGAEIAGDIDRIIGLNAR